MKFFWIFVNENEKITKSTGKKINRVRYWKTTAQKQQKNIQNDTIVVQALHFGDLIVNCDLIVVIIFYVVVFTFSILLNFLTRFFWVLFGKKDNNKSNDNNWLLIWLIDWLINLTLIELIETHTQWNKLIKKLNEIYEKKVFRYFRSYIDPICELLFFWFDWELRKTGNHLLVDGKQNKKENLKWIEII